MKKISIVAVDDHKFIREMWGLLFSGNSEIELIGESGTFDGGIDLVKEKKPDIVLLDINLKEASGINAVPLIRKFSPGTKVIVVSMHNEPAYVKKVMQLGARAFITKNSSHKEVFTAIDAVMKGDSYVCTEIKNIITQQMLINENTTPDIRDLSIREIEIIKFIKEGLSSKEISVNMKIAARTVEVHRHNILKKLKLKNTASLVNFINNTDLTFI